jgi:chromosome segregation ATPase
LADALSHERERADRLQSDIEQVASACSQAKQEAAVLAERLAVADAKATSAEGATHAIEAKLEEANAARTRAEKEAAVLAERLETFKVGKTKSPKADS